LSLQISYMGTKRQLAPLVSDTILSCKDGPLMDLFSGMCAVGSEVGSSRQVWANDAQLFASNVAKAIFTSRDLPIGSKQALNLLRNGFQRNLEVLCSNYGEFVDAEQALFDSPDLAALKDLDQKILSHKSFSVGSGHRNHFPYCLFSEIFAGGYFSLYQAMEIDSVRYAIDHALDSQTITAEQHRWLLLALAQAMSRVANTTGHFAQYLKPKENNLSKVIKQQKRGIWLEWLEACDFIEPVGSQDWRKGNKAFNGCSIELLNRIRRWKNKPSVIYADPPYTDDQYSRFYHIYETLFLYDYPEAIGVGQYRPGRFRSSFSLRSEVQGAMTKLIAGCAKAKCNLVLSYPDNGLLPDARNSIVTILRDHYSSVEIAHEVNHKHSSLGGSKGQQIYDVKELLFLAK